MAMRSATPQCTAGSRGATTPASTRASPLLPTRHQQSAHAPTTTTASRRSGRMALTTAAALPDAAMLAELPTAAALATAGAASATAEVATLAETVQSLVYSISAAAPEQLQPVVNTIGGDIASLALLSPTLPGLARLTVSLHTVACVLCKHHVIHSHLTISLYIRVLPSLNTLVRLIATLVFALPLPLHPPPVLALGPVQLPPHALVGVIDLNLIAFCQVYNQPCPLHPSP